MVVVVAAAAAAGATLSASFIVQGSIFVVGAVSIAWNATNAFYEFFVIVLVLVLGLGFILGPTGHQFCLVVFIVVMFMLVVLDRSVGARVGIKVDFLAATGATASASVIVHGGIFGVVANPIAWNATNALYELFCVFVVLGLGLVVILVLAGWQCAASVFWK